MTITPKDHNEAECEAFVECIFPLFNNHGGSYDAWDSFWGKWYVCRFENLSEQVIIWAYADEKSGVVVNANPDRFEWSDREANDVDCRLSDLIADIENGYETTEELVEAIRRECEEGIRRLLGGNHETQEVEQ